MCRWTCHLLIIIFLNCVSANFSLKWMWLITTSAIVASLPCSLRSVCLSHASGATYIPNIHRLMFRNNRDMCPVHFRNITSQRAGTATTASSTLWRWPIWKGRAYKQVLFQTCTTKLSLCEDVGRPDSFNCVTKTGEKRYPQASFEWDCVFSFSWIYDSNCENQKMERCVFPDQVEAQQLLKQTVPQLGVVHLVLQTKVRHQPHRLERQRGLQFPCVPFVCREQHFVSFCRNRFQSLSESTCGSWLWFFHSPFTKPSLGLLTNDCTV